MFNSLKNKIEYRKRYKEWHKLNSHNETNLIRDCDMNLIHIGNCSYGDISVLNYSDKYELYIGNYVSIGPNTEFILCCDHNMKTVSSFPFRVKALHTEKYEAISKGNIVVEDDVWIGYGAIILSGVHIGQGAVIAAGAVVDKDVPAYAIVGGIPAKVIKYRFSQEIMDYMYTLDYGKLSRSMVEEHINDLYIDIDKMDPEAIKSLYDWFPKKEKNGKNEK